MVTAEQKPFLPGLKEVKRQKEKQRKTYSIKDIQRLMLNEGIDLKKPNVPKPTRGQVKSLYRIFVEEEPTGQINYFFHGQVIYPENLRTKTVYGIVFAEGVNRLIKGFPGFTALNSFGGYLDGHWIVFKSGQKFGAFTKNKHTATFKN